MKIAIGNDHAATDMKNEIMEYLSGKGYEMINVGTDGHESVDYPVYAKKVCDKVVSGEADLGIAICGVLLEQRIRQYVYFVSAIGKQLCFQGLNVFFRTDENAANFGSFGHFSG